MGSLNTDNFKSIIENSSNLLESKKEVLNDTIDKLHSIGEVKINKYKDVKTLNPFVTKYYNWFLLKNEQSSVKKQKALLENVISEIKNKN